MADDRTADPGADQSASVDVDDPVASVDAPPDTGRADELVTAVRGLRIGGGTLKLNERILMVIGGILAPVGIVLVFLGWYGAAHTPNVYEQVPYLISGGLLGIGLVFLGAFFYFTHWVTELVKEHRTQSATVVEAIGRLEAAIVGSSPLQRTNGHKPPEPVAVAETEPVRLVATARGTMAHREHCTVVAGKSGLREVAPADGLLPCKLCDPYAAAT